MDPLAPVGRNESCWCGSGGKYKGCHGIQTAPSVPGAPIPQDTGDKTYLSPTVSIANETLSSMLAVDAPLTLPHGQPEPHAIPYTTWERDLPTSVSAEAPLSPADLGRLRVEVLRAVAALDPSEEYPSDSVAEGLYRLAGETIKTVDALSREVPALTVLWNEELDAATFMGRTLLLADHVLVPDEVFRALTRRWDVVGLQRAAKDQLKTEALLANGLAIPVPVGVALAHGGELALDVAAHDLRNAQLVSWVKSQLTLEGPTAREALFARAADDLSKSPANFWLHGHIIAESVHEEDRSFAGRMLASYDATYDYRPWIAQVTDSAISFYVQRTAERIVAADVFAAEYVSASLFEARLLHRRGDQISTAAQAAIWAEVPALPDLTARDLSKLIRNEAAVEDLRDQVRVALATARTPGEKVDALTHVAHEIDASARKLRKQMSSDRIWQGLSPVGFGSAGLLVGSFAGGLPGGIGAGLGLLGGLAPYLGARRSSQRNAGYLFMKASKRK